ncbi:MAG: hypothetical protein HYZ47_04770 [Simkania negevensis]|nr:hypothetical protein [Simkania negevensis]
MRIILALCLCLTYFALHASSSCSSCQKTEEQPLSLLPVQEETALENENLTAGEEQVQKEDTTTDMGTCAEKKKGCGSCKGKGKGQK